MSIESPYPVFTDLDGTPLEDGYIYVGTANLNPVTNPVAVYWDEALTQPAAQPIRTSGGYPVRSGTPSRFWVSPVTSYSILVRNKRSQQVFYAPSEGVISSNQISFLQSGTGAVLRTLQSKARENVSVKDFGAVGDGVTDDTVAATSAGNANSGVMNFPDGAFLLSSVPSVAGRKVFNVEAGATVSGSGASLSGLYAGNIARKQLVESGTSGGDTATQYIRRIADHSGGTPGWVSSALNVRTDVTNPAAANFEWAILGTIQNSATAGENTGVYGQGVKQSTGPTWGMVAEARDTSGIVNPTTGLVGLEVDTFANGFDSNNSRVGIDVVIGKDNQSGSLCETAFGIRIGTVNGDVTQGRLKTGIKLDNITFDCGFDTSSATQAAGGVAYRMAATQKLSFTALNDRYMSYSSGVLQYWNGGGTPTLEIADTFEVRTFGNVRMLNIPTSSAGLPSGSLWRDVASGNVIKMVP